MAQQIRAAAKFHLILAGVLFALGFIFAWSAAAAFIFLIFGVPILLLVFLVGGLLLTIRGVRRARAEHQIGRSRTITALAAPAMLVVFVVAALPVLGAGAWTGQASRLLLNREPYQAIIEKVRRGERSGRQGAFEQHDGIKYVVDRGPPVRIAFNPEGLLDNWSGIVFDPTGDVMLADGWATGGRLRAPDRVTRLFGGDLVRCRRLWADFYVCSFT